MLGRVKDFWHFDVPLEVHHLPGVGPTASCSRVVTPSPPGGWGIRCLEIESHKEFALYRAGGLHTYTPGGVTMVVGYHYMSGHTPPHTGWPVDQLMAAIDVVGDRFFRIRYDSDNVYKLYNSRGVMLDWRAFFPGIWKRIAVLFQPGEAVGDWAWYYDGLDGNFGILAGTPAFGGSEAKADFSGPSGTKLAVYLGGQGGIQPPDGGVTRVYHWNGYQKDNVNGIEDAEGVSRGGTGDWRVGHGADYRIVKDSVEPDCDVVGNPGGDNLTAPTLWKHAGDRDPATQASYLLTIPFPTPHGVAQGGAVKVAAPLSRSPRPRQISAMGYSFLYQAAGNSEVGLFGAWDGSDYTVGGKNFLDTGGDYKWDRACLDTTGWFGADSHPELMQMVAGFWTADSENDPYLKEVYLSTMEPILPTGAGGLVNRAPVGSLVGGRLIG